MFSSSSSLYLPSVNFGTSTEISRKDPHNSLSKGMSVYEYERFRAVAKKEHLAALHDVLRPSGNTSLESQRYFHDASDAYRQVKEVAARTIGQKKSSH